MIYIIKSNYQYGGILIYLLTEYQDRGVTYFIKETIFNDKTVDSKKIQITSRQFNIDGISYIILYDSDMKPIEGAFRFLNLEMKNHSHNYSIQAITSLKFIYSYLEIFDLQLESLTRNDIFNFLDFLKGVSNVGVLYTLNLSTFRQNQTISSYLKVYRKYVSYLGLENHELLKKSTKSNRTFYNTSDNHIHLPKYDIAVKSARSDNIAPMYINLDEFRSILKVINTNYSLRDEIIVRLMFEHGLRIGEVLGLTLEDFNWSHTDKGLSYSLKLRDRLSDDIDQHAKGCMNILTLSDYSHPNYKKSGIGFQQIFISTNLAESLLEYINITHSIKNKITKKRYNENSIADKRDISNTSIQSNYYVFLNSHRTPLTSNLWNKTLRKVFKDSGLKTDEKIRKTNLNHRLRHGLAMYLTDVLKLNEFNVKTLLRHRSVISTYIYHNPTPEDISELQNLLINSWDYNLPEN